MTVNLKDWLAQTGIHSVVSGFANDICIDSRRITANDVFLAVKGGQVDGANFVEKACAQGASLIISHRPVVANVPVIVLQGGLAQAGELVDRFYGSPSKKMHVVGITGTNGKTSVSHYVAQLAEFLQQKAGVIGTNGMGVWGELDTTGNTTPDIASVHQQMSAQVNAGVQICAMEVSSHGLDQQRTAGVTIKTGVFTNLTRDHLDYHGSMEAYAEAKAKLFDAKGMHTAIINVDDVYGAQFVEQFKKSNHLPVITYGVRSKHADVRMKDISVSNSGTCGTLCTPWGQAQLCVGLLGEFNISNLLAAIAVLALEKHSLADIVVAAKRIRPVCGRMQLIDRFVVDYAHTPDALKKALKACRVHCEGKLWLVFGCGGDRDVGKRAMMAQVAEKYADHCIITDDNPRSEAPEKITNDILSGFTRPVEVIHDRNQAIRFAAKQAQDNDLILVAGKGHEDYQEIMGTKYPYSDQQSIREWLAEVNV